MIEKIKDTGLLIDSFREISTRKKMTSKQSCCCCCDHHFITSSRCNVKQSWDMNTDSHVIKLICIPGCEDVHVSHHTFNVHQFFCVQPLIPDQGQACYCYVHRQLRVSNQADDDMVHVTGLWGRSKNPEVNNKATARWKRRFCTNPTSSLSPVLSQPTLENNRPIMLFH